jgi:hypothetical protein
MLVALDTNVLLYAHQDPKPSDAPAVARLKADSRTLLSREDVSFLVPAPAFGEWLSNFADESRELHAASLQQRAWVCPYDDQVARLVGRFWRQRKLLLKPKERSWACVKVDLEIFSCAYYHGADVLCSADSDMLVYDRAFAPALPVRPPSGVL